VRARLFWHVASVEARAHMSYRVDFWLNVVVGFAAQFVLVWFLWKEIFRQSGTALVGGREFQATVVYYLAAILRGILVRGREFGSSVATEIYEGGLTRYLVFPVPYLPVKYAQHLGTMVPPLLQFVFFGGVMVWLLDIPEAMRPDLTRALGAAVAIVLANFLHFVITFPIELVAFWADNVWSLNVAKRLIVNLAGGLMLPLSVFPAGVRGVLEHLPFRYFFDFPARILIGEIPPDRWFRGYVTTLAYSALFLALSWWVWQRGRRQYTGVGI
jgi:ABC-2 type transport system permease protein